MLDNFSVPGYKKNKERKSAITMHTQSININTIVNYITSIEQNHLKTTGYHNSTIILIQKYLHVHTYHNTIHNSQDIETTQVSKPDK